MKTIEICYIFSHGFILCMIAGTVMAEKLQAEYRPFEKTTPEFQEAMRKGQLTSTELVSYYLKRIKVYDGVLNSMITVNPKAMETAENLDKLRSAGKVLGPLHGIPVVLKDNYDTDDMVTTSGSRALATLLPRKDAFTVDRLRKAGAVIIGKTNMTEFARHG